MPGAQLQSLEDQVRGLEYTALRPPSTLHPPGTVLLIRSDAPFTAQVVCEAEEVLGPDGVAAVLDGSTVSGAWANTDNAEFSLDASYLKQVKAALNVATLRKITLRLTDPRVPELSDSVLRQHLNVSDSCASSIIGRRQAAFALTLVQSSLAADVEYTTEFDTAVEFSLKAEILNGLAPQLNANVTDVDTGTLKGNNLIWGIRDDLYLLRLVEDALQPDAALDPDDTEAHAQPFCEASLLPTLLAIEPGSPEAP